jgi:hypothetical protein
MLAKAASIYRFDIGKPVYSSYCRAWLGAEGSKMRRVGGAGAVKKRTQRCHFVVRMNNTDGFTAIPLHYGPSDAPAGAVLPGFKMMPDWKPLIEAKPGLAKIGLYAHLGLKLED